MSMSTVTTYAVAPHTERYEPVNLTARLINARWADMIQETRWVEFVEDLAQQGLFENDPLEEPTALHRVRDVTSANQLSHNELKELHRIIGEYLPMMFSEGPLTLVVHPLKARSDDEFEDPLYFGDEYADPIAPPLLLTSASSYGNPPPNYYGLLILAVTGLFNEPVNDEEIAQYVDEQMPLGL